MNFLKTKETRARKRNPRKDEWKGKIYLISCFFSFQIVYFFNMSLFLVLVFFRSDVSSMFASAEEVQHFNLILLLSSCLLASPLRSFLRLLESWLSKKYCFLLSNALIQMRQKSFFSGTNAAFRNNRLSCSHVTTIWSQCHWTMFRRPGNASSRLQHSLNLACVFLLDRKKGATKEMPLQEDELAK